MGTVILLLFMLGVTPAEAQWKGLSKVIRRAGHMADDVPLRNLDDFAPDKNISRNLRDTLSEGRHLDDAAYARRLADSLGEAVQTLDPAVIRTISQLDGPTQEMVVLVCRGTKHVDEIPLDLARRVDFLKAADGKTLCALGMDKTLVQDAIGMQDLLRMGKIPSPKGLRAVTLDDFGAFFHKFGAKGVDIWKTTIRPHWKAWAVGGALAAVLITPEEYLDEFGNWLEDAAKKLANFGTEIVAKPVLGTVQGTVEATGEAAQDTLIWGKNYFTSWKGICAILAFFLLACGIFASFRGLAADCCKGIFRRCRSKFSKNVKNG